MEPHLNSRLANVRLPRELRTGISRILDKPVPLPSTDEAEPYKRKRCLICSYQNDRKTNLRCVRCKNQFAYHVSKKYAYNVPETKFLCLQIFLDLS